MNRFFLAPALLCVLLYASTATALLKTTPYSRIQLGKQCVTAPSLTLGSDFVLGACPSDGNDMNFRFIFEDTGLIRLYRSPTLCVGWSSKLEVSTCTGEPLQTFIYELNPSRIRWVYYTASLWHWKTTKIDATVAGTDANTNFIKVDPTVKMLELDVSNVCAQVPVNTKGGHYVGAQLFAAECDLDNVNQRFIFHNDGQIELGDGVRYDTSRGWCLDLALSGTADGTKLQTYLCYPGAPAQIFQVNAAGARISWKSDANRVIGLNDPDAATPLLGFYDDVANDFTKKWRPSLGEAQVMLKLTDESQNLCLDTTGGVFRLATCIVDSAAVCSADPVDPSENYAQSFILRDGDRGASQLMYPDGSNNCVTVSGASVVPAECDSGSPEQQTFRFQAYVGLGATAQVLTVGALAPGAGISSTTFVSGSKLQEWTLLPARLPKCAQICSFDSTCPTGQTSDSAACGGVCVTGMCGGADDAICCGVDGVSTVCLDALAQDDTSLTIGNWCVFCKGHDEKGVSECSAPVAVTDNVLPKFYPGTSDLITHMRCSYNNNNNSPNPVIAWPLVPRSQTDKTNDIIFTDMKYLAVFGALAAIPTSELYVPYPNLQHLDLAGSDSAGFLFGEQAVLAWTDLEHVNARGAKKLCQSGCFHTSLAAMAKLRVLDMSHMDLDTPTMLESLKTLTSLEELHLNHNDLPSLPANFFDNMSQLTKLRMRNNPMHTTLPAELYTDGFDCDVPQGVTPNDAITVAPTTEAPSRTPTRPQPTTRPTEMPSGAPSQLPTLSPSFTPTLVPTLNPTLSPTQDSRASVLQVAGQLVLVVACLNIVLVVPSW
jgi:hypothetical protein